MVFPKVNGPGGQDILVDDDGVYMIYRKCHMLLKMNISDLSFSDYYTKTGSWVSFGIKRLLRQSDQFPSWA